MEEDIKSLLKRNLELTEENNEMLHSMRRRAFWGGVLKFIWWVAILFVLPALAYYLYLAPYVTEALNTYGKFQSGVEEAQGIKAKFDANNPFSDLKQLYEQYQSSKPAQ